MEFIYSIRFFVVFFFAAKYTIKRALVLGAWREGIGLPAVRFTSKNFNVNLVVSVSYVNFCLSTSYHEYNLHVYLYVPIIMTAVTTPATVGAFTSKVTFPCI